MQLRIVRSRSCMSVLQIAATLFLAWVVLAPPAAATPVVYSYTGGLYTTFVAPYTGAMRIEGTITFSGPLAPSATSYLTTYTDFSFTDGVRTYGVGTLDVSTTVTTDAAGMIVGSTIFAGYIPFTFMSSTVLASINITNTGSFVETSESVPVVLARSTSPGVWTLIPEPSTLLLCAVGTSLLAATRRRSGA